MHVTEEASSKGGLMSTDLTMLPSDCAQKLVSLFKLLADETRVRILYLLHQTDELNVLELCKLLEQRQPSVSHHLALLRTEGVIDMRREGKHNFYRIVPKQFEDLINQVLPGTNERPLRVVFDKYELRYSVIPPAN